MTWVHHAALATFGFGLGASCGSFLNVCVWRLPRGESVIRPPSRCPRCGVSIAARDNVPILSWLALRGRCRHCAEPISARYPRVEAAVGLLFALVVLADLAFDPLDLFDRGALSVLALLGYHLALVSLLVASAMIVRDARRQAGPSRTVGRVGSVALGLVVVLVGLLGNDAVGSTLNALLLAVFLVGTAPARSRLGPIS